MKSGTIHISCTAVFRFKGVTIDWNEFCGPIIVNRHTGKERHYKNISSRVWKIVNKFSKMSDKEKHNYILKY